MKVVGILGSPHPRGNTSILLDAVLDGARGAGAEVERLDLAGETLHFCIGCTQCYRTGRCRHEDEVERAKEKMRAADGIVLGSPVYIWSVSAQLKTLMDRSAYFVHCFELDGKYGAAVATAGGSGEEETCEFQNRFLQHCGAQTVGFVGAKAAGTHALCEQEEKVAAAGALGRDLVAAIEERRGYAEQLSGYREFFAFMRGLVCSMGEAYPAQYQRWVEKGWM